VIIQGEGKTLETRSIAGPPQKSAPKPSEPSKKTEPTKKAEPTKAAPK
jgi:hypothetical protein